ncbi:hypothetical protein GUITHDRAFT_159333 [Guillardia theta CCMP2712]|uniref:Uncharacterized protein n=2 Tax=Guillardia theta TaxID=55529 RepID=L1JSE8_GUITC|nr:hypothetical protein GUITHDRAFT_159333 [Guillardia theta CCMP2712]EKX51115.1 hypothetical protein GUITHDRAFT_159333 [Guillardia theta CCMP2712]|eukprot:XP_005838095.1 hypothetical protein GUITHDRAFT_159333 [Guillardia theta CCMP2712]
MAVQDETARMESMLPSDCLSIQEIGTAAGVFMVLAWFILTVTALFMAFKAVQADVSIQKHYYLNAFICGISVFSYFAMFSGMGWETVEGCRQYFYIRHLEWALTCSLILFSLGILAEQDVATIFASMGFSVGMIYSGYLAAIGLVPLAKWLWFFFGLVLFVMVVYIILREFRQTLLDKENPDKQQLFDKAALLTIVTWSLYPLVWILGPGIGAVGVSVEAILYCFLDVTSKAVFSFVVVNVSPYESAEPAYTVEKEYV